MSRPNGRIITCASCDQTAIHSTRGLCANCRYIHIKNGTIENYPRTHLTRVERLEDWEFLRDQGYNIEHAALRMGITKKGLEKVIERARRAGIQVTA